MKSVDQLAPCAPNRFAPLMASRAAFTMPIELKVKFHVKQRINSTNVNTIIENQEGRSVSTHQFTITLKKRMKCNINEEISLYS